MPEYYRFLYHSTKTTLNNFYKNNEGILGVDYIGMIPIMVESIKEQREQIEVQAKQIIDLKATVDKLLSIQKK